MIDAPLRRLIDAAAHYVSLPPWRSVSGPELLEGLILTESGGDPMATRLEPHQDRQADSDAPNVDDGMSEDDRSYGLMQIMGYNLRRAVEVPDDVRMGYRWALRPLANLAFGLRHLCALIDPGDDIPGRAVDVALAQFNGGPRGNKASDWPNLRNRSYVEKVFEHSERAHRNRVAMGWRTVG